MDAIAHRRDELSGATESRAPAFDLSLPGRWRGLGARHPVSRIIEDTVAIFSRLGFTVA